MSREGAPSVQVSWEEIARYDPDILVLMPCSFSLERTIHEFATLHVPEAWKHLKAVNSARVYAVEGATYVSRSGPRTIDGLQILAEIMHPELFPRKSSRTLGPESPRVDTRSPAQLAQIEHYARGAHIVSQRGRHHVRATDIGQDDDSRRVDCG